MPEISSLAEVTEPWSGQLIKDASLMSSGHTRSGFL